MTEKNIIQLTEVEKKFQRGPEEVCAVRKVNLYISEGEYIAITGHSGSGKTTLLNLIGCLDRPSSGKIIIGQQETTHADEKELTEIRKNTIGFVFQQFFLIPTLTVLQNVQLPALFAKKQGENRAKELLELVGLTNRIHHLPGQLSGGEMQRVAIARSLINSPSILLADEPTGNLDTKNSQNIMELFAKLNQQGLTLLMVTHNLELVKQCSRSITLADGSIRSDEKVLGT